MMERFKMTISDKDADQMLADMIRTVESIRNDRNDLLVQNRKEIMEINKRREAEEIENIKAALSKWNWNNSNILDILFAGAGVLTLIGSLFY